MTRRRRRLRRIRRNRSRRELTLRIMQMGRRDPAYLRADPMYRDRDGWPISFVRWTIHMEDRDYRQLVWTQVAEGFEVSTIWLGISTSCCDPPLIFETATMRHDDRFEPQLRYATESEALRGHAGFVRLLEMEVHNLRAGFLVHTSIEVIDVDSITDLAREDT